MKMHLKNIFLCLQEMIDCKNVSVLINPRDSLPTISAERCESIRFHLVRPGAMGSVYTVRCRDVSVHFKPPHREEYVLELPGEGVEEGGVSLSATSVEKTWSLRELFEVHNNYVA